MNIDNYFKCEQSKSNTNEPTLSNSHYMSNNYLSKLGNNSKNTKKNFIESTLITDNNKSINNTRNPTSENNNIFINENNNNKNNLNYEANITENDPIIINNSYHKIEPKKLKEKELILEVINSWNLPEGLMLKINKYGIENSLRKKKDGIVFFGYQNDEKLSDEPSIDYLLLPKEEYLDEKFIGKHFQIQFKNGNYYIKDLGFGFGTFIKMEKQIKIQDKFLINIGETYIVFSFENEDEENNCQKENQLNIKVFNGDEKCDSFNFDFFSHPTILIGRNVSCDVYIKDRMLSRVHCYVYYEDNDDENKRGWYLKDGNLEGKKSTNDTWYYSAEDTLICDGMVFKTNHNLFRCLLK